MFFWENPTEVAAEKEERPVRLTKGKDGDFVFTLYFCT